MRTKVKILQHNSLDVNSIFLNNFESKQKKTAPVI